MASVIGFLKGKSALAMARLCGKERNFTGEHFWWVLNWSKSTSTSANNKTRMPTVASLKVVHQGALQRDA